MDVFESLKKRVAVRHFKADPIPEEDLRKLVYAARRAPTGGNTPYRRTMVVTDKKTIRLLKQVSPGILSDPVALVVIYTDLRVAEKLGRLGREVTSLIDAGAAAENVALAAIALGLGTCFTKSYSEAGVKEVLGIPDGYRTEVIMQIGYPQDDRPPALKAKPGEEVVYIDRFGRRWK